MFSLRSVVRFRVERRDHGTIVTCEATHPALGGQRRQTQYMLDVQCEWGALGGGYGGYGVNGHMGFMGLWGYGVFRGIMGCYGIRRGITGRAGCYYGMAHLSRAPDGAAAGGGSDAVPRDFRHRPPRRKRARFAVSRAANQSRGNRACALRHRWGGRG